MSNPNDFVIENGVLKKYKGKDPVVTVPDGVTSIRELAFSPGWYRTSNLTSVTLPEGLTHIGNEAFCWCSSLTSVTLPEGLTSIGERAFEGCSNLNSVTLPEGLTNIGNRAFWGCSSLTSVTLPEGLTSIGDAAFCRCSSLTSVTLPEGLTNIGNSAFWGCEKLADVNGFVIVGGILFDYAGQGGDVTLPEGLTSIGNSAFSGCSNLTSVTLPEGLTHIGDSAFHGCSSLKSVTLPESLTSIGDSAFSYCKNLTSVTLPEGLTSIGNSAFSGCSSLTSVALPAGLTSIGDSAFRDCRSLTSITLPESLTSIGDWAFSTCDSLTSVTLPEGLTSIGESAFESCKGLKEIVFPTSLKKIGKEAFAGCENLVSVSGGGAIAFAKNSFGTDDWPYNSCKKLKYTPEMFKNAGKLPDLFAGHLDACDAEALAWVYIYQKGEVWENALAKVLTAENAPAILAAMAAHIREVKSPKKAATAAAAFVRANVLLLSGEGIAELLDALRSKKQTTLADELAADPAVAAVLNSEEKPANETDEQVLPDGTILYGKVQTSPAEIPSPMLRIKAGKVIWANPDAEQIVLPPYVKQIGAGAFSYCKKLKSVAWQGAVPAIDKGAFFNCPNLRLPAEVYTGKKLPDESLAPYLPDDPAAIAAAMLQIKDGAYRRAAIARLTSDTAAAVADALLLRAADWTDAEFMLRFAFAAAPLPGEERLKAFSAALTKAKLTNRGWKTLLLRETQSAARELAPVFFDVPFAILQTKTEALSGLPALREILPAVYPYTDKYDWGFIEIGDFRKGALEYYEKNAETETAAKKLDHKALMGLLLSWTATDGPRWYAPYAAYANEEELAELIAEMKAWEKDKYKKEQIIRVRGAILLNDTVAAMRYADSLGLLERYAKMRGLDADTLRDETISDFGLDLSGRRTWSLAGKTLTATLNNDLTFTLTDESGKELKSVPKKGADEAEYETVKKEFAALKKDVKSTAKTRNDKIFADFLSGRARPAKAWENGYLDNAVLIALARLIVWAQGENTFTLKETGELITVDGAAYTLTDEPVKVAHPMEMEKDTVESWQHYFTSNALRQPFEQVWEPVADATLVKPGRYDGCTVPLYALMNKEKHGIIMEGRSQITLKDCSADLIYIEGHHDWYNNEFEVKNFTFKTYTRQVNHIVVHLDKATVAGRIKKDDVSASQWFDRFTLAQIQSFIDLANDNKATNVLALLLEYKEKTFPDFDPMAEFTLEW